MNLYNSSQGKQRQDSCLPLKESMGLGLAKPCISKVTKEAGCTPFISALRRQRIARAKREILSQKGGRGWREGDGERAGGRDGRERGVGVGLVGFSIPTWQLTAIPSTHSRGSDALFWAPAVLHTCGVQT